MSMTETRLAILSDLYRFVPELKNIINLNCSEQVNHRAIYNFLVQKFGDKVSSLMGEALTAYSKNGHVAIPQPNAKYDASPRFFDWSVVCIVKKTNVDSTQHSIIHVDSDVFLIQYLFSGGFKNDNIVDDIPALKKEFEEGTDFFKFICGVNHVQQFS